MNKYYYDLHIHSCLSPCADDDMTPNNIAGMAALKGLNLLALTDHNSCANCPAFFDACRAQGIVPIAGMELSTAEDIHIVCLFEFLGDAMAFSDEIHRHLMPVKNRPDIFGNQLILNGDDEQIGTEEMLLISATDLYMSDALGLARRYGAHVRPAHIDRESNGMIAVLGDVPLEYGFNYVEFNDSANVDTLRLGYPSLDGTGTLVCSDAHHLWDINEAEHFLCLDAPCEDEDCVRKMTFGLLLGNNG